MADAPGWEGLDAWRRDNPGKPDTAFSGRSKAPTVNAAPGGLGAMAAAAAAARRKKAMEEAEDPKKDRGAKIRKALASGTGY